MLILITGCMTALGVRTTRRSRKRNYSFEAFQVMALLFIAGSLVEGKPEIAAGIGASALAGTTVASSMVPTRSIEE